MNIPVLFKQSIIALKSNKLRSFFSILGIVIGVMAIVIILSLGQGLKGLVTGEIEAFGPNILGIAVKIPGSNPIGSAISMAQGIKITTLKTDDIKALKNKNNFPYIVAVSGQAIGQEWATYQDKEKRALLYGCTEDYPLVVKTTKIGQGRFFSNRENEGVARVAVLGSGIAEDFFGADNPLDKQIKIKGQNFKVIGVLKNQGGISFGVDMNDMVYLPLETTLKEILGIDYLSEIHLTLENSDYFNRANEEISRLMRRRHNIQDPEKDDFQITTMAEILGRINQISVILNLLLGFLAVISLIVGGIGIMNIMLASVSERTHEIGLRKALGANSQHILYQFLIEGLIITILGGLIGIFFGVLISSAASLVIRSQGLNWPMAISWLAIFIGFSISTAIGLIFSLYPARQASLKSPMEALRYE
jgi:putative ABC transport system permease protein